MRVTRTLAVLAAVGTPTIDKGTNLPADEASRMAKNADCEVVVVVDAASGQAHGAARYCRHK